MYNYRFFRQHGNLNLNYARNIQLAILIRNTFLQLLLEHQCDRFYMNQHFVSKRTGCMYDFLSLFVGSQCNNILETFGGNCQELKDPEKGSGFVLTAPPGGYLQYGGHTFDDSNRGMFCITFWCFLCCSCQHQKSVLFWFSEIWMLWTFEFTIL